MKEEGKIYKWMTQIFNLLAMDLLMIFQSLAYNIGNNFTSFFGFECPWAKTKNLRQRFGAMSMLNGCAKFHGDSPSGLKFKFNRASANELSEMADFVYNSA